MEKDLLSLSKIFTERILRIPDYQRGYAWDTNNVNDFWNDLVQLEKNKSHYLGVLTLEDVPQDKVTSWKEDHWIINSKNYTPFFVVDGQQRLTTSVILIQAIIDILIKYNNDVKLNYNTSEEIKSKYLFQSKDDGISRSYLFGYEKDNPSYEYLKTVIFGEQSYNTEIIQRTIYTTNLSRAKDYFLEKLNEMDKTSIEDVFQKITQKFVFNIYSLDKEIDTFVAFETMNNRGKILSNLELLKNRLIYLSTKIEENETEKKST